MEHGIIFDLDPVLIKFALWDGAEISIRYYGIIFAFTIFLGFLSWRWQMARAEYSDAMADDFMIPGVLGTIIGARLGHCMFYEARTYLENPAEILRVWHGGLASHGATIGLLLALLWFSYRHGMHIVEALDRFSFSAAIGAAGIRLGNFINSGIVGRETDLPWGVRFVRYDGGVVARHPSQLYEFALGVGIYFLLLWADRRYGEENRPVGLLAGMFFGCYFTGRFLVEFVKEFQTLEPDSPLTMGQYLSMPGILAGVLLLLWSWKKNMPTGRLRVL